MIKALIRVTSATTSYVGSLASAYATFTHRLANGTASTSGAFQPENPDGFIFSTSGLTKKFLEQIKNIFSNELDLDMGGTWIG